MDGDWYRPSRRALLYGFLGATGVGGVASVALGDGELGRFGHQDADGFGTADYGEAGYGR